MSILPSALMGTASSLATDWPAAKLMSEVGGRTSPCLKANSEPAAVGDSAVMLTNTASTPLAGPAAGPARCEDHGGHPARRHPAQAGDGLGPGLIGSEAPAAEAGGGVDDAGRAQLVEAVAAHEAVVVVAHDVGPDLGAGRRVVDDLDLAVRAQ